MFTAQKPLLSIEKSLYDYDRKSTEWWKKVFYICINMCAVNAWKIYKNLKWEKVLFLTFLIDFAEWLFAERTKTSNLPLPKRSPLSKKQKLYGAALHFLIEGMPIVLKVNNRKEQKLYAKSATFHYAKSISCRIV